MYLPNLLVAWAGEGGVTNALLGVAAVDVAVSVFNLKPERDTFVLPFRDTSTYTGRPFDALVPYDVASVPLIVRLGEKTLNDRPESHRGL